MLEMRSSHNAAGAWSLGLTVTDTNVPERLRWTSLRKGAEWPRLHLLSPRRPWTKNLVSQEIH